MKKTRTEGSIADRCRANQGQADRIGAGLAIAVVVLSVNSTGDALRDLFDPKSRAHKG